MADAAPAAATTVAAKLPTKLPQARWKLAETVHTVRAVIPEESTPWENILKPIYWTHVAATAVIGDVIQIFPECGTYFAELLVRNKLTGNQGLHVEALRKVDFKAPVAPSPEEYTVVRKGAHDKYVVMRVADKAVIHKGFEGEHDAQAWLAANIASL